MGKNNYGIYIFGDLWESYSDELTADAAKHSLQSIHPTWKIEVKKTTDGEYPEFIESEAAAKGRSLAATNKDRKYFNKNEEHEVRYAQKTGRFAQSYQPTGLFAAKGKHINPKVDELYEKAGAIFNANTGNYGNMEFAREDHYSDLMNLLDEIEVGYYKHSPDGDYQEELDSQGFTLTAKEAIENLSNYIDYIMDGYPNQAIFKVTMSGNTEVNQWNKVSKPYKHDVYVIATDKAQAESEALKIMAGTHPTQYGHKTIKSVMQGNVSLPIDGSKAKVHSVKQYANGGMAKDGKAWFKEGVEAKAPNDLGGWSKSRPATVRRRMAIRSRDQKLSKHKQYISAGRALQALANVTKDPDTRDVAKRDADYFFDEAKRFADGGRVFSSQEAFEKELLEYFMPESDGFSKQADENKPGVTNYWMHINHDDEQDTYVGYFDTNTNKGSMLEPTMGGAAKGTEIREGSAIKSADLFFQEGSSDKEYHLQIIELKEGGYVVNFQYGRRGGPLQSGTKTPEPVSLPEAEKIYEKLKNEKTNKGYEEAADGRSLAATNKDRKYFNKNEEHEVRYAEQTGRATQSYQKSGGLNNLFANNGKSFSSNVTATTPMTGNEAFLTKSINVMDKQLGREIKYDFSIAYNKDFNSVVIKETDYRNPKDPYTRSLWMPFEGVHALYSLLDKLVSESVYGKAESGIAISNEVDKLHIFNPKTHTAEQVGNITIIKSKKPRSHYASMIKEVYIKGEHIPANWISTSEFNLTDLNKWAKIHNVDVNDIIAIKMRDGGMAADGTAIESVWNVSYFDKDGKLIDQTQIDEKNEDIAWELFSVFGYTKEPGMYIQWEEETDPDEIAQARMFKNGGGIGRKLQQYQIKENGKVVTLFTYERVKGDKITLYKGLDSDGKEHTFAIEQYIDGSTKYAQDGTSIEYTKAGDSYSNYVNGTYRGDEVFNGKWEEIYALQPKDFKLAELEVRPEDEDKYFYAHYDSYGKRQGFKYVSAFSKPLEGKHLAEDSGKANPFNESRPVIKKNNLVKVSDSKDPVNGAIGRVDEIKGDEVLITYASIPEGVINLKPGDTDWFRIKHLKKIASDGTDIQGGAADLSIKEKSNMYSWIDKELVKEDLASKKDLNERFSKKFDKTSEQSEDIINSWAVSRGVRKAADGAEIDAMVNDWKAVKELLGSKPEGMPSDMQVLDLETGSILKPVHIDYEQDMIIMESDQFGRVGNSLDKVKFFFGEKASSTTPVVKKAVPTLAELMKKKEGTGTPTPTVTPTKTTVTSTGSKQPFQKVEKKEPSKYAEALKKLWQEAIGSGVILISDDYMKSIEDALLSELSDRVYEEMLRESVDYLLENQIIVKSKPFMKGIKETLD